MATVTRNDTTTASNEEKTNQTLKDNDSDNHDEISMMPILAGVLIPITIFCMLSVTYSKSKAVDFGVFFVVVSITYYNAYKNVKDRPITSKERAFK